MAYTRRLHPGYLFEASAISVGWVSSVEVHERGSGGILPLTILKFRVSEMPFPAFSEGHFLQSNKQENVVFVCLSC